MVYDDAIWELNRAGFPFVLVDRFFPDLNCDTVIADNVDGGYRATEHLILLGHKEVGFLYHPQADFRTTTVRDRFMGYRKALKEYHLNFQEDWLACIDEKPHNLKSENALLPYIEYLRRPKRPVAVFVVNDNSAISLLAAAGRLGLEIPEDLAVVGFDNLTMAAQIEHPLTTIHQETLEMGVRAAQLLLGRIDGHASSPEHIVIPTNLTIRETCGARQRILRSHLEEPGGSAE